MPNLSVLGLHHELGNSFASDFLPLALPTIPEILRSSALF